MRHYPTSGNRFATMARRVLLLAALGFVPVAAQAYVGPGLGAGAIAAVLGVLGSIFLSFSFAKHGRVFSSFPNRR